jgi:hypothetical protein
MQVSLPTSTSSLESSKPLQPRILRRTIDVTGGKNESKEKSKVISVTGYEGL